MTIMEKITCFGCKSSIVNKEIMVCQDCKNKYDLPCANLSPKRFKKLNQDAKSKWRCVECKSRLPKKDNTNTPVRQAVYPKLDDESEVENQPEDCNVTFRRTRTDHITEDKFREIWKCEMKTEIENMIETAIAKTVCNQLTAITNQCLGLQETITFISAQYEDLRQLLNTTTLELKNVKDENKTLRDNLCSLDARVKILEDENVKQQQWVRLQNVEIIGVPENKDEDTVAIVKKISEKIGVRIEPSDVEFAHRVQPRRAVSAVRARPIIVRLRQRALKDQFIAAARKHRYLSNHDVGIGGESNKIFINEHLTKDNKMLLTNCKQKAKELNYKFIWTKNCRIFIRKNESSPPIPILSIQDLAKIV